jgi:hypothetical protein
VPYITLFNSKSAHSKATVWTVLIVNNLTHARLSLTLILSIDWLHAHCTPGVECPKMPRCKPPTSMSNFVSRLRGKIQDMDPFFFFFFSLISACHRVFWIYIWSELSG